jgi:hypothetical protein
MLFRLLGWELVANPKRVDFCLGCFADEAEIDFRQVLDPNTTDRGGKLMAELAVRLELFCQWIDALRRGRALRSPLRIGLSLCLDVVAPRVNLGPSAPLVVSVNLRHEIPLYVDDHIIGSLRALSSQTVVFADAFSIANPPPKPKPELALPRLPVWKDGTVVPAIDATTAMKQFDEAVKEISSHMKAGMKQLNELLAYLASARFVEEVMQSIPCDIETPKEVADQFAAFIRDCAVLATGPLKGLAVQIAGRLPRFKPAKLEDFPSPAAVECAKALGSLGRVLHSVLPLISPLFDIYAQMFDRYYTVGELQEMTRRCLVRIKLEEIPILDFPSTCLLAWKADEETQRRFDAPFSALDHTRRSLESALRDNLEVSQFGEMNLCRTICDEKPAIENKCKEGWKEDISEDARLSTKICQVAIGFQKLIESDNPDQFHSKNWDGFWSPVVAAVNREQSLIETRFVLMAGCLQQVAADFAEASNVLIERSSEGRHTFAEMLRTRVRWLHPHCIDAYQGGRISIEFSLPKWQTAVNPGVEAALAAAAKGVLASLRLFRAREQDLIEQLEVSRARAGRLSNDLAASQQDNNDLSKEKAAVERRLTQTRDARFNELALIRLRMEQKLQKVAEIHQLELEAILAA